MGNPEEEKMTGVARHPPPQPTSSVRFGVRTPVFYSPNRDGFVESNASTGFRQTVKVDLRAPAATLTVSLSCFLVELPQKRL